MQTFQGFGSSDGGLGQQSHEGQVSCSTVVPKTGGDHLGRASQPDTTRAEPLARGLARLGTIIPLRAGRKRKFFDLGTMARMERSDKERRTLETMQSNGAAEGDVGDVPDAGRARWQAPRQHVSTPRAWMVQFC
eukprot:TRINITY_DN96800_c0_g1_i1.p1 TRINITY_DN96800_c0_g1~~TRINITY_DN96800_c0_g1_i1.p1  ORF type:complete len:134 (-),score=18.63 TRINITY_DN96800_c0_g1_i1:389-790(-)